MQIHACLYAIAYPSIKIETIHNESELLLFTWGPHMYYSERAFWYGAVVWCSISWKQIIYSLTFVYSVSLACQFMQLCVVLHWGAFTKEVHLHDKTSSLMIWCRYGNYTFISTRP